LNPTEEETGMSGSVPGGAGPVGSGGLRSQGYETLIFDAHDQVPQMQQQM